jgi:translation initiation factor IF-2
MTTTLQIDTSITVGDFAEALSIPVSQLITELMKNGVMVTVNERIDFDTAQIIVEELGLDYTLERSSSDVLPVKSDKQAPSAGAPERPPVVAVMGHVDHGKTSLLDAIRGTDNVKSEAGGITQHITAYQVVHGDRPITFLDTPGHEAFSAIREHGAQLTDVALIVVAADDGIKPQTIEAIRFARKANVKMIVAINKIDKPGADLNRIKQQLSEHDLLVEEWGGDTVVVPVSAITKDGIDNLLDMILLVADVEDLRADIDVPARGLVIEAHMEQGRGAVAIALVEAGVLKKTDHVVAGASYAKIRSLESTDGSTIVEAGPSTPVVITGFKSLPEFGDRFEVVAGEKDARQKARTQQSARKAAASRMSVNSSELLRMINRTHDLQELNIVLKADVQGSLTSVVDSLKALNTDEVAVRIVSSGVGAITDNDLHTAHTSQAIIYGFQVDLPASVKHAASRDAVPVRLYRIIYELIDDVKEELTSLLAPEIQETQLGRLNVKGIFKTTKTDVICGGEVTKGKLALPALARVLRGKEEIAEAEVIGLKRGSDDAKEVFEGEMCGLHIKTKGRVDVQIDDRIELFTREAVARKLAS